MTARDRTVVMAVGVLVIVAAFWFAVLGPKRADVKALDGRIAAAQVRLTTANANVEAAESAKATYAADYATVARLGKAVPVEDDIPSLIFQLERASDRAGVSFRSMKLAGDASAAPVPENSTPSGQAAAVGQAEKETSTTSSTSTESTPPPAAPPTTPVASQASAATLPPGASVGAAGFPTMPFDFAFNGRFFSLEDLLVQLDRFTRTSADGVTVRGRLLTVDGITLTESTKGFPDMTAKIHATAYLLPASEGLLDGATTQAPATGTGTAPVSSSGGSGAAPASATITGVGR